MQFNRNKNSFLYRRKKKELQKEIDELKSQIRDMKDYLPRIVQKIGYRSVQDFLKDFKASQTEYS